MDKDYKVAYKLFFNEQLKKVSYKGTLTAPLYLQITYKRKTTNIKSSYFDIFSNPGFLNQKTLDTKIPSLDQLIKKEQKLVNFIIENLSGTFSLELFKSSYDYYSKDLCKALEDGFRAYLLIFLIKNGLADLGKAIAEGSKTGNLYKILLDLERSINPEIYRSLTIQAISSNQPYLPIYEFLRSSGAPTITIMEWQSPVIEMAFTSYLKERYDARETGLINKAIVSWLNILKSY